MGASYETETKRLGSTVSKTGKVLRALRPKSEQRCSDGPGENPRGIGINVYSMKTHVRRSVRDWAILYQASVSEEGATTVRYWGEAFT